MKTAKNLQISYYGQSFKGKFLLDVVKENEKAVEKFPGGKALDTALMEEVGELAKALLKIAESNESPQNVYDEAVQVASMAMRIAVEGCPEHKYEGMKCGYGGCSQTAFGGPCPLCYE